MRDTTVTIDNFVILADNGFEAKADVEISTETDIIRMEIAANGKTINKSIESFVNGIELYANKYGGEIDKKSIVHFLKSLKDLRI